LISDTVIYRFFDRFILIYRWAQPYFWYFTLIEEGKKDQKPITKICRKTKEKVTPKDLEKIFKKNLPKSKIVACYMTSSECGKNKSKSWFLT